MIKINKSITLTGISEVNGVQVAYLNATIGSDGNSANVTKTVTNQDLYNSNKLEVRKDIADFETEVYILEDELSKKTVKAGK